MKKLMTFTIKRCLLLVALFSLPLFAQPRVDLSEGALFLSGSFYASYDLIDKTDYEHKVNLNSDVGGGYFVLDRLAVGFSLPIKWQFTPTYGGRVGFKLFTTYFFDINSTVYPYLGGNITPSYNITSKSFQLFAGADAGILVSMSETLALDFGIRPEVGFKLYNTQKWHFSLPAGYLGIRATF